MQIILVGNTWQILNVNQPIQGTVIETLKLDDGVALELACELQMTNPQLYTLVIDEWSEWGLYPDARSVYLGGTPPSPTIPTGGIEYISDTEQEMVSNILEKEKNTWIEVQTLQNNPVKTENASQQEARLKQDLAALENEIAVITKKLYERIRIEIKQAHHTTWINGLKTAIASQYARNYVVELYGTKPVILDSYPAYQIYPFNYQGAKDSHECGFIASILANMRKQGGYNRLVEPFVGGARVFLACDFPSYLIADTDESIIEFYRIAKQFPALTNSYTAQITSLIKQLGSEVAVFESSIDFLGQFQNLAHLQQHVNEDQITWARAYIFVRNRGGRMPTLQFGKVSAKYTLVKYDLAASEEEALQALAPKWPAATVKCQNWMQTFAEARVGDIIYADPPYVAFTMSDGNRQPGTGWSFSWAEHEELARQAQAKARAGIPVFISNYATSEIVRLYKNYGAKHVYTYCWKPNGTFVCLAAFLP